MRGCGTEVEARGSAVRIFGKFGYAFAGRTAAEDLRSVFANG